MRIKLALKSALLLFIISFFAAGIASAEGVGTAPAAAGPGPDTVRLQINADVQTAGQLSEQAVAIMKGGSISREKLQTALDLYVRAGQLFEKAGNSYKALGPQYASAEEVENSFKAVSFCLTQINEIKKLLLVAPASS